MNQLKFAVLITIIILFTVAVSIIKPPLPKKVAIDDADFAFVEEQVLPPKTVLEILPEKHQPIQQNVKNTKYKEQKRVTPTPQPTPVTAPVAVKQKSKTPNKPKPVKTENSKPTAPHILTEQEEIIVWNNWRSDLQNRIMRDTRIAAPLGTGFKYSFTLDKFGTISNLKVWSTNPTYTESAVRVIKPIILSYQGKPILNFPKGTRRVITNVTDGFRISTYTVYSTPSDYSDVERVKNVQMH